MTFLSSIVKTILLGIIQGDNGMAADFFDRTFNFICEHLAT